MLGLRGVLTGTSSLSLDSPGSAAPGSSARARSRSNSREPSWRTARSNLAPAYDNEALRAEVAALKKAVKAFAELLQTNSQESRDKVIALCAALTD